MTDPSGPVRSLARRLRDEAATRGLVLVAFEVAIDLVGAADVYKVGYRASVEDLAATVEQLADRATLTEIEQGERDLADLTAIARARAELAHRLAEGGDLLGGA